MTDNDHLLRQVLVIAVVNRAAGPMREHYTVYFKEHLDATLAVIDRDEAMTNGYPSLMLEDELRTRGLLTETNPASRAKFVSDVPVRDPEKLEWETIAPDGRRVPSRKGEVRDGV